MKHQIAIKLEDNQANFRDDDGKPFVVRCPDPECARENYGPAVASGQCAWCGWNEKKAPKAVRKPTKTDKL